MQFVGLFWSHRQGSAATKGVDRYPPGPLELEPMTAWNMMQPAMGVFEIRRLGAKRGYHRRDVQIAKRLMACR
jgi:hypothetical protein